MVKLHGDVVPVHVPDDEPDTAQPVNVEPLPGVTVKVTEPPLNIESLQFEPQVTVPSVTEPVPVPPFASVKV